MEELISVNRHATKNSFAIKNACFILVDFLLYGSTGLFVCQGYAVSYIHVTCLFRKFYSLFRCSDFVIVILILLLKVASDFSDFS